MPNSTRPFKQRLAAGEPLVGTWLTLAHPAIAEMAARAGFDWAAVDLEHSSITLRECEDLLRVLDLTGCMPFVRLTSNDANQIKRVMDSGARGIIVPHISTAEEAQAAVSAVQYQPSGRRGVGLARAQGYGSDFEGYRERLAKEAVVIAMIESSTGVHNVDEILAVQGVDGYFLGPYDLSASLALPGQLKHREVEAAIARVRAAGRRARKPGGIHVVEPDAALLKKRLREGFTFVAYSLETRVYDVAMRSALSALGRNR